MTGDRAARATRSGWAGVLWPVLGLPALGVITLGLAAACDVSWDTSWLPTAREYSPVVVVCTEGLDGPAITTGSSARRVTFEAAIDEQDPDAGSAAGFFVTVAVKRPPQLRARLLIGAEPTLIPVTAITAPRGAGQASELASRPQAFDAASRDRLRAGEGAFWLTSGATGQGQQRLAVLLPVGLLGPGTWLELYDDTADDGTPIGAGRIELVRDFFYLAVIGDSLQWGNGLEERDKISTRVARVIEQETRRRVVVQRYAQTGATIVPGVGDGVCPAGCVGELPTVPSSITTQAGQIQRPELVDLVLMDGCINDVNLSVILDPESTPEQIDALSQQFCDQAMVGLLRLVRERAPQARIVVTAYYQIVSDQSDLLGVRAWTTARGSQPSEADEVLAAEMAQHSLAFRDSANEDLRAAVAQVNGEGSGVAVVLAEPGFGPDNAVFAPNAWLWGLTSDSGLLSDLDLELQLFPEDPLREMRAGACFDENVAMNVLDCVYGSVGHPNPLGAEAYAAAVVAELRGLGVLPAAAP